MNRKLLLLCLPLILCVSHAFCYPYTITVATPKGVVSASGSSTKNFGPLLATILPQPAQQIKTLNIQSYGQQHQAIIARTTNSIYATLFAGRTWMYPYPSQLLKDFVRIRSIASGPDQSQLYVAGAYHVYSYSKKLGLQKSHSVPNYSGTNFDKFSITHITVGVHRVYAVLGQPASYYYARPRYVIASIPKNFKGKWVLIEHYAHSVTILPKEIAYYKGQVYLLTDTEFDQLGHNYIWSPAHHVTPNTFAFINNKVVIGTSDGAYIKSEGGKYTFTHFGCPHQTCKDIHSIAVYKDSVFLGADKYVYRYSLATGKPVLKQTIQMLPAFSYHPQRINGIVITNWK